MPAKIYFLPVGNGDMTLIVLESGRTILIDTNIREKASNPDEPDYPDVLAFLRNFLKRDSSGRKYIDVFVWTHPDADHCRGIEKHFHLGLPGDYSKANDKIFIRELWSSPMVFRRASNILTLCDDAKALNKEAKRRVAYYRDHGLAAMGDGNRIQIMGEDENDENGKSKTEDLAEILVKVDEVVTKVNGAVDSSVSARLLGPLPKFDDEKEEDALAKNRSSVILNFSIRVGGVTRCKFLTGGDAEVKVWENLWQKHSMKDWLKYHILQAPHHCSWHSLSYDSWSEKKEEAKVSLDARNALSQTEEGALIIASCNEILDDTNDPPCIRAKREYEAIAKEANNGRFLCTADSSSPLEILIDGNGPRKNSAPAPMTSPGKIGTTPLPHG